jgi:peptidoglycan/xylan/chitin deacetylase (PgdA/CDA1 family)
MLTWFGDSTNAILQYHSVGDPDLYGNITQERLQADIRYIKEMYTVVDLPGVLESSDEKRVAITFDDGYENFYSQALPVLESEDVPVTVFVTSGFIDDRNPERMEECHNVSRDERIMLSSEEVERLCEHQLVTIGNHTRTHPRLAELDEASIEEEVIGGKDDLEKSYPLSIQRFSYPHSSVNQKACDVVAKSHEIGTGSHGLLTDPPKPAWLPRVKADLEDRAVVYANITDIGQRRP